MTEMLFAVGALGLVVVVAVIPIIALVRATSAADRLRRLEERLARLERVITGPETGSHAAPVPVAPAVTPHAGSAALGTTPPAPQAGAPASATATAPTRVASPGTPPASVAAAPAVSARRDMEQMVGGVWLQNAGSVLVLAGVFFLILWGWSTHRVGPEVLVAAGILLGLGIAWRGDRTRRTLPGIGHALIGTGLGIVYLALYLGHFTLQVLPGPVAFAALAAASVLTVLAGLRYRVQAIAVLGVIGAFVPQVLARDMPFGDLSLAPGPLLAYLAVVGALAMTLAARAGWSALALITMLLAAGTWAARVTGGLWSWPLEIGLAAVFVTLGLAPLPWLARATGRVRPVDLALVAATPLALIGCSWPMWALARAEHVAILLFAIAALYLGAAAWVDARRPERDLWRPLTGAAVLFVTAALERAVGLDSTPLAWTLEAVVLMSLGAAERGGWLRFCGYVVALPGGFWLFDRLVTTSFASVHPLPLVNPDGIRDGLTIAALGFAGFRLRAARERLAPSEFAVPALVVAAANLLLLFWTRREIGHLAWALEGGGPWRAMPSPDAAPGRLREAELATTATALAWITQAAVLIGVSLRAPAGRRWPFLRYCGDAIGVLAFGPAVFALLGPDGWARDLVPVLHRDGALALALVIVIAAVAAGLAARRDVLGNAERRTPEIWAAAAAFVMLLWIGRQADHVARVVLDVPGANSSAWHVEAAAARARLHALTPTLTSVGWLLQALATLAIGWWRRSAFLRWMGLVLVGATALKIVLVDLSDADPFWRFLAAIGAGVAMLVVSYAYQRRRRREDIRETAR
jgi:uncharacterized membrane protein